MIQGLSEFAANISSIGSQMVPGGSSSFLLCPLRGAGSPSSEIRVTGIIQRQNQLLCLANKWHIMTFWPTVADGLDCHFKLPESRELLQKSSWLHFAFFASSPFSICIVSVVEMDNELTWADTVCVLRPMSCFLASLFWVSLWIQRCNAKTGAG